MKATEDHLYYLDDLRDSGITNMWGAAFYLRQEFPDLTTQGSRAIVKEWMATYVERQMELAVGCEAASDECRGELQKRPPDLLFCKFHCTPPPGSY
jgi:hypothetical protein